MNCDFGDTMAVVVDYTDLAWK